MSAPIEDYALIGDGETAALVRRDGSIDWLCWPRFDSDACFASLLGDETNGSWQIAPLSPATVTRHYQTDTLVLESLVETEDGAVRIIDLMPMRGHRSVEIRIVEAVRGNVVIRSRLVLRFNYGALAPWTELQAEQLVAGAGAHKVVFRAPVALQSQDGAIDAELTVTPESRFVFTLSYASTNEPVPDALDADEALEATQHFWRDWLGQMTKQPLFPEAVRRSLITLKAMIYRPTGGLVAAPTTSLPESPGQSLNWDYRFCWLRDSTFTLTALLNAGFTDEAREWRDWILRAIAGDPDQMRIMYRIDGDRHIPEWSVDWLVGYDYSQPVRIGNAASCQHQADVYGEVIDAFHLAARAGIERTPHSIQIEIAIAENIAATWSDPGAGLWESRGEQRHYVYARAVCWAGLSRMLKNDAIRAALEPKRLGELEQLVQHMHAEICRDGYHPGLGRFVDYYGGLGIDASLLLLPLVGFLPIDDPRITATIATVEAELMEGGLVRRNPAHGPNPEGSFIACSCWLADCRTMQGDIKGARALIERVLAIRNDVGLLAEEYNVPAQRLAGNFPQALSHLALVTSILNLSGPTLQRAGG